MRLEYINFVGLENKEFCANIFKMKATILVYVSISTKKKKKYNSDKYISTKKNVYNQHKTFNSCLNKVKIAEILKLNWAKHKWA